MKTLKKKITQPKVDNRNIAHVKGFSCWGAHIGIKSLRRDLALIHSDVPARVSAVFTQNIVQAAPVVLSRKQVADGQIQTLVVNSGNANACTGEQGKAAAQTMVDVTAEALDIEPELVMVASTGVIGREFPIEKVTAGIQKNAKKLSHRAVAGSLAAHAILTTDTFAKEGFVSFELGGKEVQIGAIAKGSGMIHPNMGTMLAFFVTDAAISQPLLDKAFREGVDRSFNMVTVDGDTSTNDMASIMANGLAENPEITDESDPDYTVFKDQLNQLCVHLAKTIVSDGEGCTKMIEYQVRHADNEADARQLIRTISDSSLVKTAIFGQDPNWGRILAAAGRAGVDFDPELVDLYIGGKEVFQVLKHGQPVNQELEALSKSMKDSHILVILDLNQGEKESVGWGTDLSEEYVHFNSAYTT